MHQVVKSAYHQITDFCSRKIKAISASIPNFALVLLLFEERDRICKIMNQRDGEVVRASALQSVDLGFNPLVESYQKTLKNGIYSFPDWRSAFKGGCGEQAGNFSCCVLDKALNGPPSFCGRQVAQTPRK